IRGRIAAYKAIEVIRLLTEAGAQVRVMMTPEATRFVTPLTLEALSNHPVAADWLNAQGAMRIGEEGQTEGIEHGRADHDRRRQRPRAYGRSPDKNGKQDRAIAAESLVLPRRQRHPQIGEHVQAVSCAESLPHERQAQRERERGRTVQEV